METAAILIQLGIWTVILIILIYLIFRRMKVRKTEKFEHRDN